MDKSSRYITMCEQATQILSLKWEYGFVEGDYLYLGKKYGIRVIGFDYFSVANDYDPEKDEFTIKLVNTDPFNMTSNNDGTNRRSVEIKIKGLDLVVETFANPVWLPRQDQMESFYYQAVIEKVNINSWIEALNEFRISLLKDYPDTYRSGEQIALAFIMDKMYESSWNENSGKWILKINNPEPFPL